MERIDDDFEIDSDDFTVMNFDEEYSEDIPEDTRSKRKNDPNTRRKLEALLEERKLARLLKDDLWESEPPQVR